MCWPTLVLWVIGEVPEELGLADQAAQPIEDLPERENLADRWKDRTVSYASWPGARTPGRNVETFRACDAIEQARPTIRHRIFPSAGSADLASPKCGSGVQSFCRQSGWRGSPSWVSTRQFCPTAAGAVAKVAEIAVAMSPLSESRLETLMALRAGRLLQRRIYRHDVSPSRSADRPGARREWGGGDDGRRSIVTKS